MKGHYMRKIHTFAQSDPTKSLSLQPQESLLPAVTETSRKDTKNTGSWGTHASSVPQLCASYLLTLAKYLKQKQMGVGSCS